MNEFIMKFCVKTFFSINCGLLKWNHYLMFSYLHILNTKWLPIVQLIYATHVFFVNFKYLKSLKNIKGSLYYASTIAWHHEKSFVIKAKTNTKQKKLGKFSSLNK